MLEGAQARSARSLRAAAMHRSELHCSGLDTRRRRDPGHRHHLADLVAVELAGVGDVVERPRRRRRDHPRDPHALYVRSSHVDPTPAPPLAPPALGESTRSPGGEPVAASRLSHTSEPEAVWFTRAPPSTTSVWPLTPAEALGAQEERRCGDLVEGRQPTLRVAPALRREARVGLRQRLPGVGLDGPGREHVDPDPVPAELDREVPAERLQRALRRSDQRVLRHRVHGPFGRSATMLAGRASRGPQRRTSSKKARTLIAKVKSQWRSASSVEGTVDAGRGGVHQAVQRAFPGALTRRSTPPGRVRSARHVSIASPSSFSADWKVVAAASFRRIPTPPRPRPRELARDGRRRCHALPPVTTKRRPTSESERRCSRSRRYLSKASSRRRRRRPRATNENRRSASATSAPSTSERQVTVAVTAGLRRDLRVNVDRAPGRTHRRNTRVPDLHQHRLARRRLDRLDAGRGRLPHRLGEEHAWHHRHAGEVVDEQLEARRARCAARGSSGRARAERSRRSARTSSWAAYPALVRCLQLSRAYAGSRPARRAAAGGDSPSVDAITSKRHRQSSSLERLRWFILAASGRQVRDASTITRRPSSLPTPPSSRVGLRPQEPPGVGRGRRDARDDRAAGERVHPAPGQVLPGRVRVGRVALTAFENAST